MNINSELCIACKKCVPYCPMGCIFERDKKIFIDHDQCVECGVCIRNVNCPVSAIEESILDMPRSVRKAFSDPFGKHLNTKHKHGGRGTEEIKTNDITGMINSLDEVAIGIEMGRPGIGALFSDVEKITKTVSKFDVEYSPFNPVTAYITNLKTGEMDERILNEKVLSCIIEFKIQTKILLDVLDAVKKASEGINTVFSVCVICKIDDENTSIVETQISEAGYNIRAASSKTNLGLGRPSYEERLKSGALE